MIPACLVVVDAVVVVVVVIIKKKFTLYNLSCHDAGAACLVVVDAVVVVIVIVVIIKQKLLSIIPAATMLELPALLMPPNISFSLVLARKDW